QLMSWAGGLVGLQLVRLVLLFAFRRSQPSSRDERLWVRLAVIGSGLTCRGGGGSHFFFFHPPALDALLIPPVGPAGMGAAASVSVAAMPAAFYAYFLPHTASFTLLLILSGERGQATLGVMGVAYIGLMALVARVTSRTIEGSLRLRFERLDMIERL